MIPLKKLRENLDLIDQDIVKLLNRRAQIVLDVKKTKNETNTSTYSPTREKEIIERVLMLSGEGVFPKDALETIFSNIVSATRSLIGDLTVGYLGGQYSLSHQASLKKFGESVTHTPFRSCDTMIDKLNSGAIDFACAKLFSDHNSIESSLIQSGMDTDVRVIGEVPVKVSLVLASKEPSLNSIETVYATAEDIQSSSVWLGEFVPNAKLIVVRSLTDVKVDKNSALIISQFLAEKLKMPIIAKNIENPGIGTFAYAILGKEIPPISEHNKTSLLILSSDGVGSLSSILDVFTANKVSLGLIESGVLQSKAGEQSFYIELKGHLEDDNIKKSISELEDKAIGVRVIGSFPVGVYS